MEVIDQILNEWSFRCHDGVVDMNDPKKKAILEEILKEFNVDKIDILNEGDAKYDEVIKLALGKANLLLPNGDIPPVKIEYILGKNVNINGEDAKIFKALYPIAPPKKDQDVESAGSKGAGNGEIALYWLFAHQKDPKTVSGNPKRGKADLLIGEDGVEVKAYDDTSMTFGRIGSDKENLESLNALFGLNSLLSSLEPSTDIDKQPNPLRFSKKEIVQAFDTLNRFANNDDIKKLAEKYPLIKNIYEKVINVRKKIELKDNNINIDDPEDASGALMKNILLKKSIEKMGEKGGYIVNVSPNGNLVYFKITKDIIEKIPNKTILSNTSINQGSLKFNPEELFR
jgi:hypothetical protein